MQRALQIKMGSHGTLLAVLVASCLQIKRRIQKRNHSILLEKEWHEVVWVNTWHLIFNPLVLHVH